MPQRKVIVQRAFELLYTRFAWAYDAVSFVVSRGRWLSWGKAALPFATGPRVLELGHGPGHLLAELENSGYLPTGIDFSAQMSQRARQRLGSRGLPVRLIRGRAQALPFHDGAFDGVVATFPSPYIVEPETARAIRKVLRPGGRLVVVPEAVTTGTDLVSRILEFLFRITGQRTMPADGPPFGPGVWEKVFEPEGFAVTVLHISQTGSVVLLIVAERLDLIKGGGEGPRGLVQ